MNLRHQVAVHVKVHVWSLVADDLREVWKTDLVCVLELAVVFGVFLNGIVRQVDVLVRHVVKAVRLATRPNVAVAVRVPLERAAHTRQHAEAAKVKLAFVNQQRVVDVLLNYIGSFFSVATVD